MRVKRVKQESGTFDRVRRMYDSKAVDESICGTGADGRVFHVWHKEHPGVIRIASTDGKDERTVEVY